MKKVLNFFIVLCMSFSMVACGDSGEEDKFPKPIELIAGNNYIIENIGEFDLVKINTTNKITATMKDSLYYENDNPDHTYVDVVFDYTNTSSESVSTEDLCVMSATTNANQTYYATLFAIETNNYEYVSTYEEIKPLTTVRFHCAVSVPKNTNTLDLRLNIGNNHYSSNYTLNNTVRVERTIAIGEQIGNENYATITFENVEYTKKLLPTNTSSTYSYHEVDNNSNSYLAIQFEVTNYQENSKDADTFFNVKAKYMDKYIYTGFIVVEDTDQKGFASSFEDIDPLTTRTMYCLIEVPDTVIDKNFELTIVFDTLEYSYKQ